MLQREVQKARGRKKMLTKVRSLTFSEKESVHWVLLDVDLGGANLLVLWMLDFPSRRWR
jgi:hypothetical protein